MTGVKPDIFLHGMLRADAVESVLGVLLMLTGLLTVALVGVLRQRVALRAASR